MDSDITSPGRRLARTVFSSTIDPIELEAVAVEIWADPRRQESDPVAAAAAWLEPIEVDAG